MNSIFLWNFRECIISYKLQGPMLFWSLSASMFFPVNLKLSRIPLCSRVYSSLLQAATCNVVRLLRAFSADIAAQSSLGPYTHANRALWKIRTSFRSYWLFNGVLLQRATVMLTVGWCVSREDTLRHRKPLCSSVPLSLCHVRIVTICSGNDKFWAPRWWRLGRVSFLSFCYGGVSSYNFPGWR